MALMLEIWYEVGIENSHSTRRSRIMDLVQTFRFGGEEKEKVSVWSLFGIL